MLEEIVEKLEKKINTTIENADLNNIFNELSNIHEPTLILGVGGSKVVCLFL